MKKIAFSFLFILLFFGVSAQNTDHFQWLSGTWRGPGFGGQFEEVWSQPDAKGHLMGMFKFSDENGDVQFLEFWILDETGLKLRHFNSDFTAWEEREKFIDFSMIETTENKVTLKGLTYERISLDEMKISLDMRYGDEVKTEIFNLKREK